uniref:Neur_chan_LBD domain-containing protein n=1 Tax=Heterorhabditis bacteriophora TaxID=37862 RepID=A0A1I7XLA3_HETBA
MLSRSIIPNQLIDTPVGQRHRHCEYENRIIFQWDVKTLAIMTKIADGYELISTNVWSKEDMS